MSSNDKAYWQAAFNSVFNPSPTSSQSTAEELQQFFTESYEQTTDGKVSNFQEFAKHIGVVRSHILSAEFEMHEFVHDSKSAGIAWRHIAKLEMRDGGGLTEFEVILIGQLSGDGRLERVVELTRKVSGREGDEDLGSRT